MNTYEKRLAKRRNRLNQFQKPVPQTVDKEALVRALALVARQLASTSKRSEK